MLSDDCDDSTRFGLECWGDDCLDGMWGGGIA